MMKITRRRLLVLAIVIIVPIVLAFLLRPTESYFFVDRMLLWWAGFESRYVQLGPNRIHYYVGGEGSPVVFVHGLGGRASNWRPLITGLVSKHRILALDLLGYGDSDKPEDADYSIALQTDILRQFLDSQQLSKTQLVGWSMGGWIALNFTSRWPERIERLALTASVGMRFEPSFDVRVLHPETLEDVREMLRVVSAPSTPGFVQRDLLRVMKRENWIIKRALDSMLTGRDILDGRLAEVRMPVLLVWGEKDILTPISIADSMRVEMPQAQMKTVPVCGHLVPVQCARDVLPLVEQFLN